MKKSVFLILGICLMSLHSKAAVQYCDDRVCQVDATQGINGQQTCPAGWFLAGGFSIVSETENPQTGEETYKIAPEAASCYRPSAFNDIPSNVLVVDSKGLPAKETCPKGFYLDKSQRDTDRQNAYHSECLDTSGN